MQLDTRALRSCLGLWPTGVAVVTTTDGRGTPKGLTVNSFASVSLEPPLVLWSLARSAQSFQAFLDSEEFAINVLAQDQHALARRFAQRGGSKFDDLTLEFSPSGIPLLRDVAARFVCARHALHDGGDHVIMVGRVLQFSQGSDPPLLFSQGELRVAGGRAEPVAMERQQAALVLVGDELLGGSTADLNGPHIARRLRELGVDLREIRIVADEVEGVVSAVHAFSRRFGLVFVIGGLGPTHDDITATGIAAAFGLPLEEHPDALRVLQDYHGLRGVPSGRMPAVRLPRGCRVFPDGISGASGFRIENVIALPGPPHIAAHLFELVAAEIPNGTVLAETLLRLPLIESDIADELRALQARHASVKIGCYPYFGGQEAGVTLVLRSADSEALAGCEAEVRRAFGLVKREPVPAATTAGHSPAQHLEGPDLCGHEVDEQPRPARQKLSGCYEK